MNDHDELHIIGAREIRCKIFPWTNTASGVKLELFVQEPFNENLYFVPKIGLSDSLVNDLWLLFDAFHTQI